jgi:hypothetical protein
VIGTLKTLRLMADCWDVAGLRQPVSGPQLLGVLVGVVVAAAGQAVAGGVGLTSWALVFVLLTFVVQPFATLGHELGHALAVSLLGRRACLVVVGRGPHLRVRADPATVLFSVMPTRGVPLRGFCRYEPSGLPWLTIATIALAGPLATLMEIAAVGVFALAAWNGAAPPMRLLTFLTIVCLIASLVFNLWPGRAAAGPKGPATFRRDGLTALTAYRGHRAAVDAKRVSA